MSPGSGVCLLKCVTENLNSVFRWYKEYKLKQETERGREKTTKTCAFYTDCVQLFPGRCRWIPKCTIMYNFTAKAIISLWTEQSYVTPHRSIQFLHSEEKRCIWSVKGFSLIAAQIFWFSRRVGKTESTKCDIALIHMEWCWGFCGLNDSHPRNRNAIRKKRMPQRQRGFLLSTCLPVCSLLLSSPGRHLQLDDNEFHLRQRCFMSSCVVHYSWIT